MDVHDFFVHLTKIALYEKAEVRSQTPTLTVRELRLHQGKFDGYCSKCGKSTTWAASVDSDLTDRAYRENHARDLGNSRYITFGTWTGSFRLHAVCSRDRLHIATYYFETLGTGQGDADSEPRRLRE